MSRTVFRLKFRTQCELQSAVGGVKISPEVANENGGDFDTGIKVLAMAVAKNTSQIRWLAFNAVP